jgi:hypothetical protein
MKKILFSITLFFVLSESHAQNKPLAKSNQVDGVLTLSTQVLRDKIKGGWAGQTIGVTYGGPMEFRYNGTMIQEYQPIPWYDGYLKKTMLDNPGLYDDIYMDLTFVDVIEKEGMNAPVTSFAKAFAHADYFLWHANQAARYNILHGIDASQSGHWLNNPHADCIDYQIEADFAGLMCPGMPNAASAISDKVGHIMNYGDGWYGGVYIGALYTLAFTSNDIQYIVKEALKTIPKESNYYKCINDVIQWYVKYPTDWKQTWFEVQKKWTSDIGCPEGVFKPYDIDATVNSAYVVIGLLYGNGDFGKTIEIATRCGQDADCNPSSAAGILGTILGYDALPAYWKQGLKEAEAIDFKYTTISLAKVYDISFNHALKVIENNGGRVEGKDVMIKTQQPIAVRLEKSFENQYPVNRIEIGTTLTDGYTFDFTGTGFVLSGLASSWLESSDFVLRVEVYIDNEKQTLLELPADHHKRRAELLWKYNMKNTKHTIRLKALNANKDFPCKLYDVLVYSDTPEIH